MSEEKSPVDSSSLPIYKSRPGLHHQIFSSYKPVLLFLDFTLLLLSFAAALFITGAGIQNSGILVLLSSLGSFVFIFIFWVFNLYSYGANFIWKDHFKRIKKALLWILITFGMFVLLLYWDNLYSDKIIVPSIAVILLFLVFLNPTLKIIRNLTYAFAACLLGIGVVGMVVHDGLAALKAYSSLIPFFYLMSAGMLLGGRYLLVHIVFKGWMRKIFRWKMVIIGSDEGAKNVTNYMIKNDAPFFVNGFITSETDGALDCSVFKNCLGDLNDLPEIAAFNEINDIVITDENIDKDMLLRILDYCIEQRLNVWFSPNLLPIISIKIQPDFMCGLPMIKLCTQKRSELFNKVKHGLDALITLPLFVLQLPVFAIIAAAIKLNSEGPVFYKADAIGKNGRLFRMYKFRSMCINIDCRIHRDYVTRLIKGEIGEQGIGGQTLKITDDPRVTAVGRFLRRFSLDELPQLINVLEGEMSLVGPRPCLPYEFEHYQAWYKKRVSVRPGITGVWQVSGRSEVAFEDMILLDLYYIYNRSVLLDFQILYETVFAVLKQKGAY
jgi:exopolysaccharide biosynthesis polyprenyl glycosylphosphotransferase